jgi:hypothetical protein
MTHDHEFQLDLDGQVTCVICGTMDDEHNSSGSYNGRIAVSETENVGPIPTPEAYDKEFDLEELTQAILEKAKSEVKGRYGNKKRHRQ